MGVQVIVQSCEVVVYFWINSGAFSRHRIAGEKLEGVLRRRGVQGGLKGLK
jgi:hypothetical protein